MEEEVDIECTDSIINEKINKSKNLTKTQKKKAKEIEKVLFIFIFF